MPLINKVPIEMEVDTDFLHESGADVNFWPIGAINTIEPTNEGALGAAQVFDIGEDDRQVLHFQGQGGVGLLVSQGGANGQQILLDNLGDGEGVVLLGEEQFAEGGVQAQQGGAVGNAQVLVAQVLGAHPFLQRHDDLQLLLVGDEVLNAALDVLQGLQVGAGDQALVGGGEVGGDAQVEGVDHVGPTQVKVDVGGQAKLPQQIVKKYTVFSRHTLQMLANMLSRGLRDMVRTMIQSRGRVGRRRRRRMGGRRSRSGGGGDGGASKGGSESGSRGRRGRRAGPCG